MTCAPCTDLESHLKDDPSCWSKQTRREQAHVTGPAISARMRKRRAFADRELENVMLERELRQRELQNDLSCSPMVPVLHPSALSASPSLHCCVLNKDPTAAATSSYVSVYKYKPVYECDFQFYQLFHLKSSSHAEGDFHDTFCQRSKQPREDEEMQNGWNLCDKKEQPELTPPPSHHRHHGSTMSRLKGVKPPSEIMDPSGSSTNTCSMSGSNQVIMSRPDISESSRTFGPLTAKSRCTDAHTDQASAHAAPVKGPCSSPVRTAAVKPLPFSVEALLRA